MTANHAIPLDVSGQVAQELYVPVNAMLSAISELHERLPSSAVADKDAALLLKLIEMNSHDLRELVLSLQCLLQPGHAATHSVPRDDTRHLD